jgi:hypothetical protein
MRNGRRKKRETPNQTLEQLILLPVPPGLREGGKKDSNIKKTTTATRLGGIHPTYA